MQRQSFRILTTAQETAICTACPLPVCIEMKDYTCNLLATKMQAVMRRGRAERRRLLKSLPVRQREARRVCDVRRKGLGYRPEIHGKV